MPATAPQSDDSKLQKVAAYFQEVRDTFHLEHLEVSKWLEAQGVELHQLQSGVQQSVAFASLAATMAFQNPAVAAYFEPPQSTHELTHSPSLEDVTQEEYEAIMAKLRQFVLQPPGHLAQQEELYLEQQLTDMLGFEVTAELEGHRLNHSFGVMGGEQHLPRFPGDTIDQHDAVREAGITTNRGAFGWFTEGGVLTDRAIAREKYYFAVQTLYLPDWNTNHKELKPWYAFRKMVVVNPADELAVVGVVADAGPAQWVDKQFGGSPEVIREGKIWSKASRGRVLLFFVDDPNDQIPLGVIDLKTLYTQMNAQLADRGGVR